MTLRLPEMLRRRGAVLPEPADRDAQAAVVRCAACRNTQACDAWLAELASKAPRTFCPNSGYVEYRRQISLQFTR